MEFIKKHKKIIIIIAIVIIILFTAIGLYNLFFSSGSKSHYGNRLNGIENVKIANDSLEKAKQAIVVSEKTNKVTFNITGRIINYIIDVKKDVDLTTAQSFSDLIVKELNDEQKKYYDVQVFISSEDEKSELYPIIGYRHKTVTNFSWSNTKIGENNG